LLRELENYWRAQRQGKAGHDIPWLFLGKKTGESMDRCVGANIYYRALKKSGVRRKGGIHLAPQFCNSPHGKRRRTGLTKLLKYLSTVNEQR
jgi:hypothetical protein